MIRMHDRAAALLIAALLGGCDPSPATTDAGVPELPITGCPGERPADDGACVQGDGWRDCGGTGAPRFACEPGMYVCAWFDGGCVPTSWIASPCAAEDVCCVEGWAYASDALVFFDQAAAYFHFQRYGTRPRDRAALSTVSVVVDPTLEVGAEVVVAWSGEPGTLCAAPGAIGDPPPTMGGADRSDDTLSLWALPIADLITTHLDVEVDPDDPTRALVCHSVTTDGVVYACPATEPPRCADSGTLTLSAIPSPRSGRASIAARLEARFGDLVVSFELPP